MSAKRNLFRRSESLSRRPIPKRLILLSSSLLFLAVLIYLFWDLPNPTQLTSHPIAASTKLYDRHGKLLYEVYANQRRTPIHLNSLPKYVWQATLAAEDKDFYKHSGFSITGYLRAAWRTVTGQRLEGGSTITQQLVKMSLLSQDRTLRRKIRELTLSLIVEAMYSKDQILEMYLNTIPYGGTAYGLESASETYFGKPAKDLSVAQAALLAGLPQAPSYYSPYGAYPKRAQDRQKYVLDKMVESHFIDKGQFASASAETISYAPPPTLEAPHFSLWVKDLLIQKYGLQTVEQGGLSVYTTLDLDLQHFAQDTIATEVGKLKREHVGNGAALVTQPKTGQILAMVGSKDYFNASDDGNVNVVLMSRQPGSSIKPLTYAIAIEKRLITPATVLSDKSTCFTQPEQPQYCPVNYDNQFHGPTQARFALGNSFNIPAVKALALTGLSDFVASASAFGITTWPDATKFGPSLTLGGGEVTMLDLSTAYGVFANAGQKVSLNPILQVQDRNGKVLESISGRSVSSAAKSDPFQNYSIGNQLYAPNPPSNTRVISSGTAFLISHMLYDNGARSATFGTSSYLNVRSHPEVSVKTGTTNDKRDNWTVGYNPDILAAVWVGNNDNSEMSAIASGVTGASPIWNKIMSYALKDSPQHWPTQPAEVVGTLICTLSGERAPESPDGNCSPRYEYFLSGTLPPYYSNTRRDIPIYKPQNVPASSKQLTENPGDIEYQNHAVLYDPLGTMLCLDCAGGYGPADIIHLDRQGKISK